MSDIQDIQDRTEKRVIIGDISLTITIEQARNMSKMFKSDGFQTFRDINKMFKEQEVSKVLCTVGGDVEDLFTIQAISMSYEWADIVKNDVEDILDKWNEDDSDLREDD